MERRSSRPGLSPRKKQGIEELPGPHGFLPFQHPRLVAAPPAGSDWIHEAKFDGYRVQVHVAAGQAQIFTRNGLDWTDRFERLAALAGQFDDCVLDAELIAPDAHGYSDFSSLRSKIHREPAALRLMVFDILFHRWDDLRPYALAARKRLLRQILDSGSPHAADHIRYVEPIQGAAGGPALLAAACQLKWEGIVSKRLDARYLGGAHRSDTWRKAKCRPTESIVVGGYVTRNGRFQYLIGGVREPDGRLRYVGSIKGGYPAGVSEEVQRRIKPLAAARSPFDLGGPRKTPDIHWLHPRLIAEVEMAEFTASGQLRQASFKGWREDLETEG